MYFAMIALPIQYKTTPCVGFSLRNQVHGDVKTYQKTYNWGRTLFLLTNCKQICETRIIRFIFSKKRDYFLGKKYGKRKEKVAHKTFISYKYSEAQSLRDRIIKKLGENAQFYKGETADSPDLTDTSTENIKKNLRDMMYDTSVTIVILSPHMKESKWIDWEIEYCLKKEKRKDRTSQTNGVVGVIMKVDGGYKWLKEVTEKDDGCSVMTYHSEKLFNIINNNRFNQNPKKYSCDTCKCVDYLTGSYISFVAEDAFLEDPNKFIDNAFDKSENDAKGYDIKPTR